MSATRTLFFLKRRCWPGWLLWLAMTGMAGAAEPVTAPRIDRLPQPLSSPGVDLAHVARGFDAAGVGVVPPAASPRLLVFISLAMPEGAVRRLIADGTRAGAVLVLRGLEAGSLVKTAARVTQLTGGRGGAIQIDPPAFARFGVEQVPMVVLARDDGAARGCQQARCASAGSFVSVAGDVSLAHALAHVERNAPHFRADAARLRALLEP
ncbi:MAG: type-F conjugative transfer system pilin assembly protein TrbC [Burkholderiaceae bacterium]|nr:type-F conjugative transfer system pilin assembly protein TrbC [Burkholderiaceae bacterium]